MTSTRSPDFDAAVLRFFLKMLKVLCVLITIGAIAAGQDVAIRSSPLLRHYADGQKLTYHMHGINENWHYEIQADGIVKSDSDGTYFEQYGWSHFISDGQAVTLSPASLNFRQQLTLDLNHKPGLPNLAQVDGRLIGPITDFFTFYVDVWLSVRTGKLTQPGDHYYFKQGTPASWAEGNYVLLGQSSIDFDFTLKDVNRSRNTVTLIAQHVPPDETQIKLPAEWTRKPVADTPNNWVTVQRMKDGTFLGAVGKETFIDEIVLSLSDGMILSATMDNRVQTIERECTDSSVAQCGAPKPHFISRQVEISLKRERRESVGDAGEESMLTSMMHKAIGVLVSITKPSPDFRGNRKVDPSARWTVRRLPSAERLQRGETLVSRSSLLPPSAAILAPDEVP